VSETSRLTTVACRIAGAIRTSRRAPSRACGSVRLPRDGSSCNTRRSRPCRRARWLARRSLDTPPDSGASPHAPSRRWGPRSTPRPLAANPSTRAAIWVIDNPSASRKWRASATALAARAPGCTAPLVGPRPCLRGTANSDASSPPLNSPHPALTATPRPYTPGPRAPSGQKEIAQPRVPHTHEHSIASRTAAGSFASAQPRGPTARFRP
jgi:hypothetical protein